MMGGSESGSGDKDGVHTVTVHVPIGWQRRVEDGLVAYISPSGTVLSSLEEVKSYLLTDGTCKCGLECPLVIHKVFNFSVGIKVQQHSQPAGKCEQDMTKLCNHRRKVVAMAALCRSMQASQMPYVARHPDVTSGSLEHKNPQRMRVDRDEERVTYPSKHPLVPSRPNSIVTPNPCASPKNSSQLVYSYNGSSPLSHAVTNSPHSPEVLRRLPPPLHLPATASQFTGYGTPQRSPRTPTPHNLSHGLRTPHTPEGPRSPHLGPLSPPPPSSSPVTMGRGGHPHSVVGSPLSPSCSPSPSVSMSCPSPRQRSRHPSASSSFSEPGLGGAVLAGYPPRRISSSPHSPLPGGSPNLHFPKYKLEDILEQFRNSGSSSTNNHILHPNSLCNQSHPQILSLALEKSGKPTKALGSGSGTAVTAGPSGMPLGQFLNHKKQPHPASFPASSLLSAAAKAQLASQMTHSQSPSLEVSQESQQSKSQARRSSGGAPSPSAPHTQASPAPRWSPSIAQSSPRLGSPSPTQHPSDRLRQAQNHHADAAATIVRSPPPDAGASAEISTLSPGLGPAHPPSNAPSSGHGYSSTTTSPRPLDLSNHVLALLAASSNAHPGECGPDRTAGSNVPAESRSVDQQGPAPTKPSGGCSPGPGPCQPPAPGDASGSSPLAEAFPFMSQEQLLQLLSATAGLPSLLDSTVLGSLPMGLWMGGQQGHLPPSNTPQPHHQLPEQQQQLSEHQQNLLLPHEEHQEKQHHHHQQQNAHMNHSFPFSLLPSLVGGQGELPLNLLGLLNPLPPPSATPTPGQEADLGMGEKMGLQALLMASLLLGQQQAAMLPLSGLGQLSLDLPLHQQHIPALLEGLSLDKSSGLPDPSSFPLPGLLEALQGLLPPTEGPLQALQSLLLPSPLPPPAFLSLSPALLTAALGSNDLPPAQLHPTQQPQQPPSQVSASDPDGGVDTLIPLSVQGKYNPVLHQLLPTLLNPGLLGDLSAMTSLHSLLGLGAGPLLLPPVQASALGMALLQDPDGAINLLNNLQLNMAPPTEGEKSVSLQETDSSAPQEDIPANRHTPEAGLAPSPAPASQRGEGSVGSILDPYASFMDTIYTSFLQVSAKEQEAAQSGADALCALPPSYPEEPPAPSTPLPQASAPLSLSPRRACSLRNSDLSRLSMEAAHSPAQGTPKPSDDGSATPPQIKPGVPEARTNPPQPPVYLEEAKTDSYSQAVSDRQGEGPQAGEYPSPRDEAVGLQQTEQNQTAQTGGARRGRKRKQTLQNVLEDFRDLDASVLEEPNPTVVLLKPERSVRGRRRRGARSQRQ
ncbi:methyl-CpG-binding domain protein 6 isoform X2 [Esox lucius]|uniref:methyl-CpG-binding domain protein 6 isoform X2 n=1 Tax=Esox lucius TaxID=8010 RepID=UPI00147775B5|nr:methyl-CpG-binding domain protein 6 isoform X2 [Esox lucius]